MFAGEKAPGHEEFAEARIKDIFTGRLIFSLGRLERKLSSEKWNISEITCKRGELSKGPKLNKGREGGKRSEGLREGAAFSFASDGQTQTTATRQWRQRGRVAAAVEAVRHQWRRRGGKGAFGRRRAILECMEGSHGAYIA